MQGAQVSCQADRREPNTPADAGFHIWSKKQRCSTSAALLYFLPLSPHYSSLPRQSPALPDDDGSSALFSHLPTFSSS